MDEEAISGGLAGLLADVDWAQRLAAALVGEHDGEDLVQRVLTGALRRGSGPAQGPGDAGRIRGYWRRALRFEAANLRRGQARRAAREEAVAVPEDRVPDPAEAAEHLEQRRRLAEQLLALPEDLRYLLVLRYENNLDSSEIGRRLNLSPSTVRSSLARARQALRQRLEQEDPDWMNGMSLLAAGAASALPKGAGLVPVSLAIMNAKGWMAIGILGLLAITGWGLLQLDEREETPELGLVSAEGETPAMQAADPGVDALPRVPEQRAAVAGEAPEVRRESSAPDAEFQPATYPPEFRLLAQLLDESGEALVGGKLVFTEGAGLELVADSGGKIDAVLNADSVLKDRDLSWRVEAPGERHAIGFRRIGAEDVVQLGDLQVSVFASYTGRVVDSSGEGLSGLSLSVTHDVPEDPFAPPTRWASGRTDSGGYFSNRLDQVRGPVSIRVSSRGWTSAPLIAEPVLGQALVLPDILAERSQRRIQPRVMLVDDREDPIPAGLALFDFRGRVQRETFGSGRRSSKGQLGAVLDQESADEEPVELLALAPAAGRWGTWKGTIQDLRPAKQLVLQPMPQLQLRVLGGSTETLAVQEIVVRTWFNGSLAEYGQAGGLAQSEGGVYSVGVPGRPFEVEVDLGPDFAPLTRRMDGPPSRVLDLVAASPYPLIRGRVQAEGAALAGASISLHRGARPGQSYVYNDCPIRFDGSPARTKSSSAADGTFELPFAVESPAVLVIQASGYAPQEVDLEVGAPAEELLVELQPTGRVRGRVRMVDGADPTGLGYVLLRGGLDARTGKLGEGGEIDVDGLAPGGWYLRPTRLSIDEGDDSAYSKDGKPWDPAGDPDFIVRPGEVSALDLTWPSRHAGQLRGRLLVDGVPMAGWRVALFSALEPSLEGVDSYQTTKTDADGRYELEMPSAQRVRWTVNSSGTISLSRELDRDSLQGGDLGDLNLRTALLGLDGTAPAQRVTYRVTLAGGVECMGRIPQAGDANVSPARVPAGELVLLRMPGAWGESRPPLGPYRLKPGELLRLGSSELQGE